MTETKLRDRIAELGRSIFDRGMTAGSSGTISVQLDDGWLLTPTNSCLERLDPARISKLAPDGRHIGGDPPSKELFLHSAMYQMRESARAIVLLHSTHSVAVSCLPEVDSEDVLPPLTAYYVMKIGRLPLIPYYRPGDEKLGEAIRGYATEELEQTAKLYLLPHGRNPRCLTEVQIAELREAFSLP